MRDTHTRAGYSDRHMGQRKLPVMILNKASLGHFTGVEGERRRGGRRASASAYTYLIMVSSWGRTNSLLGNMAVNTR